MPKRSRRTLRVIAFTTPLGFAPALYDSKRFPPSRRRKYSAKALRAGFPGQRKSTRNGRRSSFFMRTLAGGRSGDTGARLASTVALLAANAAREDWGAGAREQPLLQPEGQVHEPDQCRYFDERPDHAGESLTGGDPKHADSHCDGQLEVVPGGGERKARGLLVVEAKTPRDEEGAGKHHPEVDEQRDRDPQHVHRQAGDLVPLH